MKQVSRSCAARAQKSSPRLSWRIWETKWSASRNASSQVWVSVSGFHHQRAVGWVMACGSNTHTVPLGSRAAAVVVHTSGLFEVARTAPGASRMPGAVSAVVLPARGAITAMTTSSSEAYRIWPFPRSAEHPARGVRAQGDAGLARADQ